MTLLFILEVGLLGFLYILSSGKYKELLAGPEAKGYSFTALIPSALLLIDKAGYKYNFRYDRKIAKELANLHGSKSLSIHVKLYYGSKLATMQLSLILLTLFGAASGTKDIGYIIFTLLTPALVFYVFDKDLENKLKKRFDSIRADFPDVVSKLVLLVNSGMTLNRAWEKVCLETRKNTPLYQELKLTYLQIQGGKPEGEAYEEFARRCRAREITKFITLVLQNMKKGTGDLVPLLKLQAEECWELRKMRAKQLGEEASAKLILPMMIMFIGILIIVVLPAVLQLSSI